MTTLQLHPLCTLFPRVEGAEFEALKADILANGLREPLVVHEGMILDGGNRYRACAELGIEPATKTFTGGNLVSFVLSANLHRRHLTSGQQAAIVASAQDWAKANIQGRNNVTGNVAGDTVADRAALSGASERTQRMADKVAKQDPELSKQVAQGAVTLPQAVRQITAQHDSATEIAARTDAVAIKPPSRVDADEKSSAGPADDDVWAEMESLRKQVSALNRQIDSLTVNDQGAEIQKLTQQVFHLENRVTDLSDKNVAQRKQLDWFGTKFNDLRKLTGATQDRDVVGLVRKLVEGAK